MNIASTVAVFGDPSKPPPDDEHAPGPPCSARGPLVTLAGTDLSGVGPVGNRARPPRRFGIITGKGAIMALTGRQSLCYDEFHQQTG